MTISQLCDWVILIGATCIGLTNIYNFFAKPKKALEDKRKQESLSQIENILELKMPDILLQHDLETRAKYLADRQNYLCEIKQEVLNDTKDILENLLKTNETLSNSVETLTKTSKDVLRQRIMEIYYKYRSEKRMPIHAKEALDELYKDYKAENGNSYIDKYYGRMGTWTIYDDEEN